VAKRPHLVLSSPDDVEHAFYDALAHADLEALMACWAEDEEVSCIAPGIEPLHGREAIQRVFADMFERGMIPVRPVHVHKTDGMQHAVHTVTEHVQVQTDGGAAVAVIWATNVYVRTSHGWRLVLHHASTGQLLAETPEDYPSPSTVLH
jgi:ketosteroid isomerase-like protein